MPRGSESRAERSEGAGNRPAPSRLRPSFWLAAAACAMALACEGANVDRPNVGSGREPEAGISPPLRPGDGGIDVPISRGEVGSVSPDAACVSQSIKAERLPLDLYVMLDASYSMLTDTAMGMSKWDAIKAAINGFASDPASAGISMGLQVFPIVRQQIPEDCFMDSTCAAFGPCLMARACSPATTVRDCQTDAECGSGTCVPLSACTLSDKYCLQSGTYCGGEGGVPAGNRCEQIPGYCIGRDVCEVPPYATPTVPVTPLPMVAPSIRASLDARKPEGLTPVGPALAGAIEHARARAVANPGAKMAVVLASDGLPSACTPNRVTGIVQIAREGAEGSPSIPTFAVGVVGQEEMAASRSNLSAIATAGSTVRPFIINTAANVTKEFQAALEAIRANTIACEFKLPKPAAGALDYTRVNVVLTAGDGSVVTLGNVKNRAACDGGRGGWYYDVDLDSGANPSAIIACPSTCDRLRAETSGRLDVLLGCQTVVD